LRTAVGILDQEKRREKFRRNEIPIHSPNEIEILKKTKINLTLMGLVVGNIFQIFTKIKQNNKNPRKLIK